MRTTKELRAEAKELTAQIESGKLTNGKLKKAKARARALIYHADRRDKLAAEGGEKAKPKSTKTAKPVAAAPVDTKQLLLPNFVEQMVNPRVEEMVANLINEALRKSVERKVEEMFPSKKAK